MQTWCHAARDKSVPLSELQCSANLLRFIGTVLLALFVGVFIRSGISNSTHTSSCFDEPVPFLKTPQRQFSMEKFRKYTKSNNREKYCKYKEIALHSLVTWILFIRAITFPLLSMQWSTMWSLFAKHSTGHYFSLLQSTILTFLIKKLLFAHDSADLPLSSIPNRV